MKSIFLFCNAAFLLFSCTRGIKEEKKVAKNDLSTYKLKGEVKSLRLCSYDAKDSAGQALKGTLVMDQNWKLDEKGNFTERDTKLPKYNRVNFDMHKYDSNEHLVKDSSNNVMGTIWDICLYNTQGNRIEQDGYYLRDGKEKRGPIEIYKWDDKGNKIEEDSYWSNKDSLNYKAYFKYNEHGQEIEENILDDKGKSFLKMVRTYDDKGNPVAYERYNSHDSLESKSTFTYDEKGNEIENCTYKKDGALERKQTTKYDDMGNIQLSEYITLDNTITTKCSSRYQDFDKEGNWLKSIDMKDGKPAQIIERSIEYYP